jgi:hypothetical protein
MPSGQLVSLGAAVVAGGAAVVAGGAAVVAGVFGLSELPHRVLPALAAAQFAPQLHTPLLGVSANGCMPSGQLTEADGLLLLLPQYCFFPAGVLSPHFSQTAERWITPFAGVPTAQSPFA